MATYRTVYLSFWTDPKVDDDFTPEDKFFYLYLLTNPHTNICGCYEISMKQMVRETGYNEDTVKRLIARMETVHNVIRYDSQTKEVLVLNWHKYNWTKSDDMLKGAETVSSHIKSDRFRDYVANVLEAVYGHSVERVYRGSIDPVETSVTVSVTVPDTVTGSVTDTVPVKRGNTHPSVEEVEAYCREKGYRVDATAFVAYYASQGWKKANGQPLKDWKQGLVTWVHRDKEKAKDKYGSQNFDQKEVKMDQLDNLILGEQHGKHD